MLTVSHPPFSPLQFSGTKDTHSKQAQKPAADTKTDKFKKWAASPPGIKRLLAAAVLSAAGGAYNHDVQLQKADKEAFCTNGANRLLDYSQLSHLEKLLTGPSEALESASAITSLIQNNVLDKKYLETRLPDLGNVWLFKGSNGEPRILQLDQVKSQELEPLKNQLKMQGFVRTKFAPVPQDPIPTLYCDNSGAAKNVDEIINMVERGHLQPLYRQTNLADGSSTFDFVLNDGSNVLLPFINIKDTGERERLLQTLSNQKFKYDFKAPEGPSSMGSWMQTVLFIAAFLAAPSLMKNMSGGVGPGVGKFKPTPMERPNVRMQQVAGNDLAKSMAKKVIKYLKDSEATCHQVHQLQERKRYLDSWKNKTVDVVLGTESDKERQELREQIDNLLAGIKKEFPRPRRGVLFEGPTRSGKTLLAKAIAGEAGVPFFYISGEEFSAMYHGQGGERVRHVFEQAAKYPQSILFIDEADQAAAKRQEGIAGSTNAPNEKTTAFLTQFDKWMADYPGLCVMMATNFKEQLDPALLQNGRMDTTVTVDYPGSHAEVIRVFDQLCKNNDIVITDPKELKAIQSSVSELYRKRSPGDMELFLKSAIDNRNTEALEAGKPVPYTEKHFAEAWLDENVGPKNPGAEFSLDEQTRIAYHEYNRGHAFEGYLVGWSPRAIVSGARGKTGGLVLPLADNPTIFDTLDSTLRNVLISVAGQAAETDVYSETGTSQGARQDYDQVEMKLLEALYEHRYFPGRLTAPTFNLVNRALERMDAKEIPEEDLTFINDILNMAKNTVTKHYRHMEGHDPVNWQKLQEENKKFASGHVEYLGKDAREHFPTLFRNEDGSEFDKAPYEKITQEFINDVCALSRTKTLDKAGKIKVRAKILAKYPFFKQASNPFSENHETNQLQDRLAKDLTDYQQARKD
ncbi:MAG TPA: AAA family ATPase [Coleofasciculaceae cyanobacterium]